MKRPAPEPDEERAQQILKAFRQLERQERIRGRLDFLIWLLTLVLIGALVIVLIVNLQKFKLFYQLLNQPDSLLSNWCSKRLTFH
jgi:cell division septal protein FtsQ